MAQSLSQLSSQIVPEHFVRELGGLQQRFQRLLSGVPISRAFVVANVLVQGLTVVRRELDALAPSATRSPEKQKAIAAQIFRTPSPPKGARWLREQSEPPTPIAGENKRRVSEGYVRLPAALVAPAVLNAIDDAGKHVSQRLPDAPLSRSVLIREALSRGLGMLDGMLNFHETWKLNLPKTLSPLEELLANRPTMEIAPSRRGRPPLSDAGSPAAGPPIEDRPLVGGTFVGQSPDWSKVDLSTWKSDAPPKTAPVPPPAQQALVAKSKARARSTPSRADAAPPQTHARARRSKRTATSPPQDEGADPDPDPDGLPTALLAPLPTDVHHTPLKLDDATRALLDYLVERALSQ